MEHLETPLRGNIGAELIGLLTWQETLITGLVLGLSSMGLYSGGKALTEHKTDTE